MTPSVVMKYSKYDHYIKELYKIHHIFIDSNFDLNNLSVQSLNIAKTERDNLLRLTSHDRISNVF